MLAAELVYITLDELSQYRGCNIEDIVDDPDIYEDIIDNLIETVGNKLSDRLQRFLED